jgi:hypothetical protein
MNRIRRFTDGRESAIDPASLLCHGEYQLAEVAAFFHASENFAGHRPGEVFAYGAKLGEGDGFVHVLEVLA